MNSLTSPGKFPSSCPLTVRTADRDMREKRLENKPKVCLAAAILIDHVIITKVSATPNHVMPINGTPNHVMWSYFYIEFYFIL